MTPTGPLPHCVAQHVEELALLWHTRGALLRAGRVGLSALGRHDDRVAAHIDGCAEAGAAALEILEQQLETHEPEAVFAAAVVSLITGAQRTFRRCLELAEAVPGGARALTAALGWTSPSRLAGVVKDLMLDESSPRKRMGLAACALHRVNPGVALGMMIRSHDTSLRARALRTLGELGRVDLAGSAIAGLSDDDPDCRFWAAWSAVLLGDRSRALEVLSGLGTTDGAYRERAFRLALQAADSAGTHATLRALAQDPGHLRWLIQGTGLAGDPSYVPWLIAHMADTTAARLAGESFSLITGADLDVLQLWRPQPEGFESGPTDNPEDENVEMDPDEGLMWPDQVKVQQWWSVSAHRFQPGQRYFMGAPVTRAHCVQVLDNGTQRQRILAAHYLGLLAAGTPVFNTSAPAWRQQRQLARLTRLE